MDRTTRYLNGRFKDFYRRNSVEAPPESDKREWAFQLWESGNFIRHNSSEELGGVDNYLAKRGHRHIYVSAAIYEDPSAKKMENKTWKYSDLIFDLDADPEHMDTIDDSLTYPEKLEECKKMVRKLLNILENDFGFKNIEVVFSGGRGYHVHVRDERVRKLGRSERGEIVNYISNPKTDIDCRSVDGGLVNLAAQYSGGWNERIYNEIVNEHESEDVSKLVSRLGVEQQTAERFLETSKQDILSLNLTEEHVRETIESVIKNIVESEKADVDEPVTTDINRLIRLPGSLHGGTGLRTTRVDELDSFNPLTDSIPDIFKSTSITVDVTEEGTYRINDDETYLAEGEQEVPEYLGIYLMASGNAEKAKETN